MRRARRLLPIAILAIAGAVGLRYSRQRAEQITVAPPPPKVLPLNTQAANQDWVYTHSVDQKPVVEVRARDMRHIREPDQLQLDQVELRLFHKEGQEHDLVRSASAVFDRSQGALISEGEVEITLGAPQDGPPRERLMRIRSSGVRFEEKSGKASTDRRASFQFDRGDGESTGAEYDPTLRVLRMLSQVRLRWGLEGPPDRVMTIETGELVYREQDAKIFLTGGARLRRGNMVLEGSDAVVTLEDGEIRLVEARQARGGEQQPRRLIEYAADQLNMNFGGKGVVEKITAEGGASLTAKSDSGWTRVTAGRVDLEFDTQDEESRLKRALGYGSATVESRPAPRGQDPPAATRMLKAEAVELTMRAGGEEIDRLETHSPGTVEFLPNHASQRRRRLEGERFWIHYGEANHLKSFRAVNVQTRTDNHPRPDTKAPAPGLTWSRDLLAHFDPKTGEMTNLEQWGDFRFEEGDRRAKAERALFEAPRNRITLETGAEMRDAAGSVTAGRILLDQNTGDFTAEGEVTSMRMPDKKGSSTAMLSAEEPVQAVSHRMTTSGNNQRIVYDGGAVLWQGASRLEAGHIEIDRKDQILKARDNVASRLVDGRDGKKPAPAKGVTFTTIRAPALAYAAKDRLAHYSGDVVLVRSGLEVRAREIRAFLREADVRKASSDSSLERAIADGAVKILQSDRDRSRRASSEHAEYYAGEEKVMLSGGHPQLIDSKKGTSRGRQLTWWANNDRLLVEGAESQPVVSRITR